jgi:hypothetical protein
MKPISFVAIISEPGVRVYADYFFRSSSNASRC